MDVQVPLKKRFAWYTGNMTLLYTLDTIVTINEFNPTNEIILYPRLATALPAITGYHLITIV